MRETQPEHIWTRAKADYLLGLPVGRLCTGYNLARSTFYDRARREGWLRSEDRHAAEEAGELKPSPVPPPPAPPLPVLAQQALDQAAAAIAAGDVTAANGWLRAVERLRKLTIGETGSVTWRGALRMLEGEKEKAAATPAPADPPPAISSSSSTCPSSIPPYPSALGLTPGSGCPRRAADAAEGRQSTEHPALESSPGTTDGETDGAGVEGYWWYADEVPDGAGHPEPPKTEASQGISTTDPDSPAEKNSEACFTSPQPITDEEIAAAEAGWRRLTDEVETMGEDGDP